jgi:hypothetical protein
LHDLSLASTGSFIGWIPEFAPSCLRRLAHHSAALLGADVAPPSRAEADSGSLDWFRRQLITGEIKQLDSEIEQGFGRKARPTHKTPQAHGAPRAQSPRQFGG